MVRLRLRPPARLVRHIVNLRQPGLRERVGPPRFDSLSDPRGSGQPVNPPPPALSEETCA